jgi:Uncharacterized conserved protein (DUF2249)
MSPLGQFKRFDVRDHIRSGVEPFPEIRKRVESLKPAQGLIVVAPFLPSPLTERLAAMVSPARLNTAPELTGWFTFGAEMFE